MIFKCKPTFYITGLIASLSLVNANKSAAQMHVNVIAGQIQVNGMNYSHDEKRFKPLTDSLDNAIKTHPLDTTALFKRAVLYLYFNDLMAKPAPETTSALANLEKGNELAQKALKLKMTDLSLKILIAQLEKEMAYRFTADQSWQFNNIKITERRKEFNEFKTLANQHYDELQKLDSNNAFNYQRLKVKNDYPIK